MKRTVLTFALVMAMAGSIAIVGAAAAPKVPHSFYGDVVLTDSDGNELGRINGLMIQAKIGGEVKGKIEVEGGSYGGPGPFDDKLDVRCDECDGGEDITFTLTAPNGEKIVNQKGLPGTFHEGNVTQRNLTFSGVERQFFAVGIDSTNSPVKVGKKIEVTATIENTGDLSGTQNLTLEVGGEVRDTKEVTLTKNVTNFVTFTWDTESGDAGSYEAVVASSNDTDSVSVKVKKRQQAGGGGGGAGTPAEPEQTPPPTPAPPAAEVDQGLIAESVTKRIEDENPNTAGVEVTLTLRSSDVSVTFPPGTDVRSGDQMRASSLSDLPDDAKSALSVQLRSIGGQSPFLIVDVAVPDHVKPFGGEVTFQVGHGMTGGNVTIARWDGSNWKALSTTVRNNTIRATTSHWSVFAVFNVSQTPTPTESPTPAEVETATEAPATETATPLPSPEVGTPTEAAPETAVEPSPSPVFEPGGLTLPVLGALIAILVVIGLYAFYRRSR